MSFIGKKSQWASDLMTRCFAGPDQWTDDEVTLQDEEARHLSQVLRLGPGQTVTVFDGKGRSAKTEILQVGRKDAVLNILEIEHTPKPIREVHLT